jgi:hypothetical protein
MNLQEFYANPERAHSGEITFGSAWRVEGEGLWTLVWLEATGEVVAFSLAALQGWEPSGVFGDGGLVLEAAAEGIRRLFRQDSRNTEHDLAGVLVLGVEPDRQRLEARLAGWEDRMAQENSLLWAVDRFVGPPEQPH